MSSQSGIDTEQIITIVIFTRGEYVEYCEYPGQRVVNPAWRSPGRKTLQET